MIVEIPVMVIEAGVASASLLLVGGGLAGAVLMIDHAFDKVKETGRKRQE